MKRTSLRPASEAGLISQILLRLSNDAKRARTGAARARRSTMGIGRVGERAGERTREALRELDLTRRTPARER
jgi:hypothetical protein